MTLIAWCRSASSIEFQNGVPPFSSKRSAQTRYPWPVSRVPSQRTKSLSSGVAWLIKIVSRSIWGRWMGADRHPTAGFVWAARCFCYVPLGSGREACKRTSRMDQLPTFDMAGRRVRERSLLDVRSRSALRGRSSGFEYTTQSPHLPAAGRALVAFAPPEWFLNREHRHEADRVELSRFGTGEGSRRCWKHGLQAFQVPFRRRSAGPKKLPRRAPAPSRTAPIRSSCAAGPALRTVSRSGEGLANRSA